MSEQQAVVPVPLQKGNPKRKKALLTLAAIVAVVAVAWGGYEWLVASHYETTDNAYVQGNVIQITPQVGGTVMSINADATRPPTTPTCRATSSRSRRRWAAR
jgi:membrane fusion protein (multidrug efflux system)